MRDAEEFERLDPLLLDPANRHAPTGVVRRHPARVSRQLHLLRAHGLIHQIPDSDRYRLPSTGHLVTAALLAVRNATLEQLLGHAA